MQPDDSIPHPLRVLHLEDSPADAELIRLRLEREQLPVEITLAAGETDFTDAVKKQCFDLILADANLRGYDGMAALALAQQEMPETPFVFVCGSLDEEQVINSLRQGAADYVMKHQLGRLGPTTRRVLREARGRRAEIRSTAFSKLGQSLSSVSTPTRAAEIIVNTADVLLGWDACSLDLYLADQNIILPVLELDFVDGKRMHVPPSYSGAPPSALVARILKNGGELILREDSPSLSTELTPFGDSGRPSASLMFVPIRHGAQIIGVLSIQSYQPQAYSNEDLNTLQALADHCGGTLERIRGQEALSRLAAIVESSEDAIVSKDLEGVITSWNTGAEKIFGYCAGEAVGQSITLLLPPERLHEENRILDLIRGGERVEPFETVRIRKDGQFIAIWATISPIRDASGKVIGASKIAHDITERKKNENRLAAFSQLSRKLSAAATPRDAAQNIAEIAQNLFGWDALTLDSYSAEEDSTHSILNVDTIHGKKVNIITGGSNLPKTPTLISRRVMGLGAELILKQEPITMLADEAPFGDTSRPSASIMRVAIQYRTQTIGILSLHSYSTQAYNKGDLATLQTFADYCAGALERIRVEEKMASLNTQLLNSARRAGMEEVANSVLHNVGNVLNSVNVSATLVQDTVANSKLSGLNRAAELLKTHATDLPRFLTTNPQGRELPGYLATLAEYWTAEQAATLRELESLNKNLLHIKNIINRQQSLAGASSVAESVFVSDLLEDALAIGGSDLARCGIAIAREYTVHFPAVLDRLKLMLILVNLVGNARDALIAGDQPDKQLKVRTELRQGDRLRIIVADNGAGIAVENLTRIFNYGFTTKKSGHGFGLHSSALAARELGGSLVVESSGVGKGSQFTVELPLQSQRRKAAGS